MTPPRPHLPQQERRAETVAAVVDLAATRDPSEITTAEIAGRMRLTQGALFRHFRSKDEIWEAVLRWVADRLLERVEAAAGGAGAPLAALAAVFDAHVEFVLRYPGVPRVLFGELQRRGDSPAKAAARRLLGRYGERIAGLVREGQRRGEIASPVDPEAAAALFLGAIQGLVVQSLLASDFERLRATAPRVLALYLRALGAER
jgi:TetR/AcrR family transcriptional regulator